jgi:hypothetical protein
MDSVVGRAHEGTSAPFVHDIDTVGVKENSWILLLLDVVDVGAGALLAREEADGPFDPKAMTAVEALPERDTTGI